MKVLMFAGALVAGQCAPALAEDACAKFDDAFAYNQCLASQGPKAHAARAIDVPAGEKYGAPGAARDRIHASIEVVHRRNGRMVAEFTILPGPGKARGRKKLPDEPGAGAPSQ